MRHPGVKKQDCQQPTRRSFLRGVAIGAMALVGGFCRRALGLSGGVPNAAGGRERPTSQPSTPTTLPALKPHPKPWWRVKHSPRSKVVDVRSELVAKAPVVDPFEVERLLERGLLTLTGAESMADAWRATLGDAQRIVLKFNHVGAEVIGTNEAMARALLSSLSAAGYASEKVALVEGPGFPPGELTTRAPAEGWGAEIPVGGGLQELRNYLYEADAVINVPFLKTHQIAGMSGALKNLSHALMRHPARCHAHGCSPFVGQVVGHPAVASRLKLHIVNAVRVVVDKGPDAERENLASYGGLLVGFDPVAVDMVGLRLLDIERRRAGLEGRVRVPYLLSASQLGVGRLQPSQVERIAVEADV